MNADSTEVSRHELKADTGLIMHLAMRIERETPFLIRVSQGEFKDRRTGEILSAVDVVSKYQGFLPEQRRQGGLFEAPDWFLGFTERVGVHLIEAQRLLRFVTSRSEWEFREPFHTTQFVETVTDCAADLRQRISDAQTNYAKESQILEQSFPERLLTTSEWHGLSVEELQLGIQNLDKKRQHLKLIGLIGEDVANPFNVAALEDANSGQRMVMTLFVADTERKLTVLDDLARRIEILLGNINSKFKHKTIRISKDQGLTALTPESKVLELEALSSGEQHELVLLYDLLFRVKPNTLVLIDEPELSLHVNWQKSFLPDLLQIVEATNFDVLMATHSPLIVGDRSDLMVPLRVEVASGDA